jgi:hypothetical protein
MAERDGWKRREHGYDLLSDGRTVGTVYRAGNGMWCWSSAVAAAGGYRMTKRDAKAALVASLESNHGQA